MKQKILLWIGNLVCSSPRWIVSLSLLLAILSLFYAAKNLNIDSDQDNLISNKLDYHQRYRSFLSQFGDLEYAVVVIEVAKGNKAEAARALISLKEKIKGREDLFREIRFRDDLSFLKGRWLLLLPHEEFDPLIANLYREVPMINQLSGLSSYAEFFEWVNQRLSVSSDQLQKNQGFLEATLPWTHPILEGIGNHERLPQLSLERLMAPLVSDSHDPDFSGWFYTSKGHYLLGFVMPVKDYSTSAVIEVPLNYLRSQLTQVKREFPNLSMGITGRPVLQADEIKSTGQDSIWAGLCSLLLVGLLFICFFRQVKGPLLALLALLIGIAWTLGLITLTVGHLNLLTVTFAVILLGLGIDYGAHFLFRYQQIREVEDSVFRAIHRTMDSSTGAIITASLSSAAAFLSAIFTDFLGLRELGLVAGGGVLLCLASQIMTFPALLVLTEKYLPRGRVHQGSHMIGLEPLLRHPKTALLMTTLLTLGAIPFVFTVRFENNLLKLQASHLESVEFEKKLTEESDYSTWFAAILTPDKNEVSRIEKSLDTFTSVARYDSINMIVPPLQTSRLESLNQLKLKFSPLGTGPLKALSTTQLRGSLLEFKKGLEHLQSLAFKNAQIEAVEELDPLIQQASKVASSLSSPSPNLILDIKQSQEVFFSEIHSLYREFLDVLSPRPIREEDLPRQMLKTFKSKEGQYAIFVYPSQDIWQPADMEQFVGDLRKIDPKVTGAPISVYESSKRMKAGFYLVGIITLSVVILILQFDFRQIIHTVIASLPLLSGMLWLVAMMGLLHVNLNLANFFALPILIGISIDSGVHLMHRFRETRSVRETLGSLSPVIILAALTTTAGFGTLSFVNHRGLASFGHIMVIGSLTCLVASLLIVPLVLQIFYSDLKLKKQ